MSDLSVPRLPSSTPIGGEPEGLAEKCRTLDEKISSLAKKAQLLRESEKRLLDASPDEKTRLLAEIQQLHDIPKGFTEKLSHDLLRSQFEKAANDLRDLRAERAALVDRKLSALDKQIVDLGIDDEKKQSYRKAIEYRELEFVRRLFFETMGGPTRRAGSRPGDIVVELKSLEGSRASYMLVNFWKNLADFYEQLPQEDKLEHQHTFQILFTEMEKAFPFFDAASYSVPRKELLKEIVVQIKSLKDGESILLPGGFSGHGIVYEIKKNGGTYSFRVFNSGGGLNQYHVGRGEKYSNVLIQNIPASALLEDFFEKLYSLMNPERLFSPEQADDLYRLLRSLGPLESDESFRYHQGQIGSCSYQPFLRWAKTEMGARLYRQFREYTLQSLLKECPRHFGEMVRSDDSVRASEEVPSTEPSMRSPDLSLPGEGVDAESFAKLTAQTRRSVQRVSRNILIDRAVERVSAIPDEKERRSAFLSIINEEKLQATILNHQDRALVLLRISKAIFFRRKSFLDEVGQTINEQIFRELSQISEPEQKAATEFEIAKTFLTQGQDEEALTHIDRALQQSNQLGESNKTFSSSLIARITETFLSEERRALSVHDDKRAFDYLKKASEAAQQLPEALHADYMVRISQDLVSLEDVEGAKRALETISDPVMRDAGAFIVAKMFFHKTESAGIEETSKFLVQAAEIATLLNNKSKIANVAKFIHSQVNRIGLQLMDAGEFSRAAEVARWMAPSLEKIKVLSELVGEFTSRKAPEEEIQKVLSQLVETTEHLKQEPSNNWAINLVLTDLCRNLKRLNSSLTAEIAKILPPPD